MTTPTSSTTSALAPSAPPRRRTRAASHSGWRATQRSSLPPRCRSSRSGTSQPSTLRNWLPPQLPGREPLGLEGYPALVAACAVPVVAIGDVRAEDTAELAATGVAGLAIVRGIMQAEDPKAYAESVVSQFSGANER